MATVWLARDTRLAREVAIKLPSEALSADESFVLRFDREAQTAAALTHPGLVSVYDYGLEGDRPYLVSEYVDGANLAEVRARGDAPSTEVLARALLEALAHIHEAGIVHRDIKPGNVLVDSTGRILLTDFGIAQSSGSPTLTAEGHVVGTPSYLAPEIKRGGRADARSDLYAVGVLLGEQLSDRDPDRIFRLVDALTETDPAARPVDAEQALELIERRPVVIPTEQAPAVEWEDDEPEERTSVREIVTPPPPPRRTGSFPLPPPSDPQRERPWGLIAGGIVGALLVAALAFSILGSGGDDSGEMQAAKSAKESGDKGSGGAAAEVPQAEPATTTVTEQATTTVPSEPTEPDASAPSGLPTPIDPPDPAQGAELNDQGYQLLQSGDPAGALPVLEKAVASYPADSTDLNYGYALFNYAQALRLTGNPEAAIPVLKRRLGIPDQLDAVRAELEAARQAAGG
jgi:serine/threonine-protein kinase